MKIVEFEFVRIWSMLTRKEFEKEFDSEEIEMMILVKSDCGGAVVYKDMLRSSVDFLASVDVKTGTLSRNTGCIEWLIENDENRKGWGYDFKQFGIYHIKVRKCIRQKLESYQTEFLNNRYMLVELIDANAKNIQLEKLQKHYAESIIIENELGTFKLNREFSCFEGQINWHDMDISIFMETDEEDGESAEISMSSLLALFRNFDDLERCYRLFAAKQLTALANDWLEDDDNDLEDISQEMFAKRIKISGITLNLSGELILYYHDDDMFWGHSIEVTVDSLGVPKTADIVG